MILTTLLIIFLFIPQPPIMSGNTGMLTEQEATEVASYLGRVVMPTIHLLALEKVATMNEKDRPAVLESFKLFYPYPVPDTFTFEKAEQQWTDLFQKITGQFLDTKQLWSIKEYIQQESTKSVLTFPLNNAPPAFKHFISLAQATYNTNPHATPIKQHRCFFTSPWPWTAYATEAIDESIIEPIPFHLPQEQAAAVIAPSRTGAQGTHTHGKTIAAIIIGLTLAGGGASATLLAKKYKNKKDIKDLPKIKRLLITMARKCGLWNKKTS